MSEKSKRVDPIPDEFASYEEAAEFWDAHDTTDYPGSFEDVAVNAELKRRRFEVEVDEDFDQGALGSGSQTRDGGGPAGE